MRIFNKQTHSLSKLFQTTNALKIRQSEAPPSSPSGSVPESDANGSRRTPGHYLRVRPPYGE